MKPKTWFFGNAFEHWLIAEIFRLNHYYKKNYRFHYLLTKDQAEIDLIVERPGRGCLIVEIKSTDRPDSLEAKKLEHFLGDFQKARACLISLTEQAQQMGQVLCLPWREGITWIFGTG